MITFQKLFIIFFNYCLYYQQFKRKGTSDNNEAENNWTSSPGYNNIIQSPFQTPVSTTKAGKTNNRTKASKGKSGPQTPASNAGEKCSYLFSFLGTCIIQGKLIHVKE